MRRPERNSAGIAQLVEHQPSKLRVAGSSPVSRSMSAALNGCSGHRRRGAPFDARVAQQVEHLHGKQKVTGSNPVVGSKSKRIEEVFRRDGDGKGEV
jgi:hypothetical protein